MGLDVQDPPLPRGARTGPRLAPVLRFAPARWLVPVRVLLPALALIPCSCSEARAGGDSVSVALDWPSFRGPFATGVAAGADTVLDFDLGTGRNVLWTADVEGLGCSSPVVAGERLFLTTAAPLTVAGGSDDPEFQVERDPGLRGYAWTRPLQSEGPQRFELLALDKHSGRVLWSRTVAEGAPFSRRHPKSSHANPTPATDAERVVAWFGAEGLFAFDHAGALLWSRDFGKLTAGFSVNRTIQWGVASSPVLHEGKVLLLVDASERAFLACLDAANGDTLWLAERNEVPTWGTPTVDVADGRRQVIVNGSLHLGAYDLDTGSIRWSLEGGGAIPIPTPVVAGGLVFATSSGGMPGGKGPGAMRAPILAIPADARGELDVERDLRWAHPQGGSYIPTPLVVGDELYCLSRQILTCLDAATGAEHYRVRLPGSSEFSASPIAAGGRLYLVSEEGEVHALEPGPEYAPLARSELGEVTVATPAVSGGVLYFRTRSRVVAVGPAAKPGQ